MKIEISTANPTWASYTFRANDPISCRPGDGIAILHREGRTWRTVTGGSDLHCPIPVNPHQPRVPASVSYDLLGLDCRATRSSPAVLIGDRMPFNGGFESRPRAIYLSSNDSVFIGGNHVTRETQDKTRFVDYQGVHWASWAATAASSLATLWDTHCNDCADPRRLTRTRVRVTAYRPRRVGRDWVFTRLRITPRAGTAGSTRTFTLARLGGAFNWQPSDLAMCSRFIVGHADTSAYPGWRLPAHGSAAQTSCATLRGVARYLYSKYRIPKRAFGTEQHWGVPFTVAFGPRIWTCRLDEISDVGPVVRFQCRSGMAHLAWATG